MFVDHLLKAKKEIEKFKETEDSRYIYQHKLDKGYFQHDMTYRNFKDLLRKAAADKVLYDEALNIAKNLRYDGDHRSLTSMVYKFLIRLHVMLLKMNSCKVKN